MLKNYLIVALRNLSRQKSFSWLNIAGLTLGISSALIIFLVVRFELSFDRFHTNADRIYRVLSGSPKEAILEDAGTPHGLREVMSHEFSEIEKIAVAFKVNPEETQIEINDNITKEDGIVFATPTFFEIFDYDWVVGSPESSLSEPGQVVINEQLAEKYFGGDAIGKRIIYNNKHEVLVSGVIKNMPRNTDLSMRMIISHATFEQSDEYDKEYNANRNSYYQTFVLLKPGTDPESVNAQFPAMIEKYQGKEIAASYMSHALQPISEMHFSENVDNFSERSVSKEVVYSLALIGLFLLVTACINFINLTTAQAVKRSKEVGVRKALGSSRTQLVKQFMGETALLTLFAVLLSYLITVNIIPYLSPLFNISIDYALVQDLPTFVFLLVTAVFVSILAGFYPSIVLSSFRPVTTLKNTLTNKKSGGLGLRKTLIVFQFALSQVLIICTIVVLNQMHYFNTKSLGFVKEAVLTLDIPFTRSERLESFRQRLKEHSAIHEVSFSLNTPAATINKSWTYFGHSALENNLPSEIKFVDPSYLPFYDLQLLSGRNLIDSDSTELVVNEAFLKTIGIDEPDKALGEEVEYYGTSGTIVGVVRDFHSLSLQNMIPPLMLTHNSDMFRKASLKIDMTQAGAAIATTEEVWKDLFPKQYFAYKFLDDDLATMYEQERNTSRLLSIFASIAIFIGCLGLYGLISFMTVQKEKEMGIRKVLGGSTQHIVYLFTREFIILVSIAFLIALPLGYYLMNEWLNNFIYSIELEWWMFALAALSGILIAALTVSYKSLRAALVSPANSLRGE
ncbi:ABC transporter permease [Porifericola rhodea]|uniref:ABC transporter permease n=1 Tax=Porifericola rhodea TaxID=930972 RepID=UPI0026662F29|nr:ABC transporter permease [Porifericola rhodea]WKN32690.1 ABC transporter permease [Porifericola rhodea]